MKTITNLALIMCLIAASACAEKAGYAITGTAQGTVDGDSIFICDMQGFFQMVPIDTTVVKDGKFEFTGTIDDGVALKYILPTHKGTNEGLGLAIVLIENANIKVQIFTQNSGKEAIVESDGPEFKLWKQYQTLEDEWNNKQQPSWDIVREQKGTTEEIAAAQKEMDKISVQMHEAKKKFMFDHIPSGVSDLILSYIYSESKDETEKQELLKIFKEKSPNTPNYKKIAASIEAVINGEVGSTYTDFTMADPSGKDIRLSDYVKNNKYTLVDFWASWCGPCCAEMPNVVKAYNKFHGKGLEIVGVSLDNNKNAWLKGLERLKMAWPQMSDIKGWECEGAALYGIKSIPSNILIDRNGKIVAKNLREEELHTKLAELLP